MHLGYMGINRLFYLSTGPSPMTEKTLQIHSLPDVNIYTPIGDISSMLDRQKRNFIDIEPWPEYPEYYDLPKVSFGIAYSAACIFIKFDVQEHEVLARYRKTNDPVYKDSCVEFFIAFDDDQAYYNLEFNRFGTCLGGYGPEKEARTLLPAEQLEAIRYERTLLQKRETKEPAINWTLTLAIPAQVFSFHHFTSLQDKKCKVNFYKCGDDLSQPHYLAWNPIESPKPNFHLPCFFGRAEFKGD
ncbi:MAG: hypothetical protein JWP78_1807 [Mucilaginibacter sp.]|nr:hypothetical protein [Mucilaginibacter sp.]